MSRKDYRVYIGLAAVLLAQSVAVASGEALPIKKIGVDASKQIVVEIGGPGAFPTTLPHVLDLPGPNHRVVLDFAEASLDKGSLPSAEELSATVTQALPFVKSVRYSNLENAPQPTARIVFDLPEDLKVKPRVVKLEEGHVTISFGDDLSAATASGAQPAAPAVASAAAPAPVAPAAAAEPGAANGGWDWSSSQNASASEAASAATPASAPAAQPQAATAPSTDTAAAPTPTAPAVSSDQPALKGPMADGGNATPAATEGTPAAATTPATDAATAPATAEATAPTPDAAAAAQPTAPAPAAATTTPEAGAPAAEGDKKLSAVRHYNQAVQAHLHGKLDEAISEYKLAVEANPTLCEAHSNMGLIYNQQHNYAQALAEFRKALAINPKDAITYNGIGAALRAEKDLQGAIKNWQTAVSLDPKLATAHYNLGTAYEIEKDYDKALASYGQAVKNDYRLGEAYYRMGLIMERKHRNDDAAQQFQEAIKVSADSEYSEDARQRLAYLTQSKKGKTK